MKNTGVITWMVGGTLVSLILAQPLRAANPFEDPDYDKAVKLEQIRTDAKKKAGGYTGPKLTELIKPGGEVSEWLGPWITPPGDEMNDLAKAALAVASRMTLIQAKEQAADIDDGATKRNLLVKMDVARHELIKFAIGRAIRNANEELRGRGCAPIRRVAVSNCSTIGDGSRDADLTIHAEDEVREAALFRHLSAYFNGLNNPLLSTRQTATDQARGVAFSVSGMEISFHRGFNDVPPPHEPMDLMSFALTYRRNAEKQFENPEAYVGFGAEQEVQGRRGLRVAGKGRPQVLVQNFMVNRASGKVAYEANQYTNQRLAMDALRMTLGPDYTQAHDAMHIFCDFVQASHHQHDDNEDVSKGPLKYGKRALNALCRMYGFGEYDTLSKDARLQVIRLGLGPGQPDTLVANFETALHASFLNMRDGNPQRIADSPESRKVMSFLRRAAARSLQQVARVMMDPAPVRPASVPVENWVKLNRVEQDQLARQDPEYAKRLSVAAMENLVIATRLLAQVDIAEANRGASTPFGHLALRQVIEESGGNPRLQRVLQLASDHAQVDACIERTPPPGTDVKAWAAQRKQLVKERDRLRYELSQECAAFRDSDERKRVVKAMGTPALDLLKNCPKTLIPPDLTPLQGKRAGHAKIATGGDDPQPAFQRAVQFGKNLGGLAFSHASDPNNIPDMLSLVEMAQTGAGADDYKRFLVRNIAGRYNPVVGYAVGITETSRVPDAEEQERQLKEMGKGVVFDVLSRYVPGCAQAKLIFDIEKGIVNVTYGHAIRGLNSDLVDAIYMGEAGRVGPGRAGTLSGWVRDAVEPVLPDTFVVQYKDDAQKPQVGIDTVGLYKTLFTDWTGRPYDRLQGILDLKKGSMSFVKAHDALVKCFEDRAEGLEPGWFEANTLNLYRETDLEAATRAFLAAADPFAREIVRRALASIPNVREYTEERGGKTVNSIEEGLVSRLCCDMIAGMEAEWKTLAMKKRQLRKNLDGLMSAAITSSLAEELASPEMHLVRGKPLPSFAVTLSARTPDGSLQYELDGNFPLPLICELKPQGEMPDDAPKVEAKVLTGNLTAVPSSYRPFKNRAAGQFDYEEAAKDASLWANNVFRQDITLQAVRADNGAVLGETKTSLLVRFAPASAMRLEPSTITGKERVPLVLALKGSGFPAGPRWEWDMGDGYKRTTYEPKLEYTYAKAGTYNVTVKLHDRTHIVPGGTKGTVPVLAETRGSVTIADDRELRHVKEYWDEAKTKLSHEYWYREDDSGPRLIQAKEGEEISYYENGNRRNLITWSKGEMNGPVYAWYENGKLEKSGNVVNGKGEGLFTDYYENGQKSAQGTWRNDHVLGKYTTWDQDGNIESERNYNAKKEQDGIQKSYNTRDKGGRYLWRVEEYSNGKLIKSITYNEDGTVLRQD